MSRGPRIVVPGTPHHITQRGVRQSNIFVDTADYCFYSDLLFHACRQYGMSIHSYSWMTNHVHIIAVPQREDTFEKVFRKAHAEYARKFNKKYELRGHLWQGPFYSCPMDEVHYWAAIRYVERNPVRAGIVRRADEYRWSSSRAHCGLGRDQLLVDLPTHPLGVRDWSEWLTLPNPGELDGKIRKCTHGGWPCGDEGFVEKLESVYGRPLRPQKPGPK